MYVAVSSFMVYYLLHVALLRSPTSGRFAAVAQHFLVWSGYAAVASLTAAVFPDRASPFLYVIFGWLLSVGEVLYMFEDNLVTAAEVEEEKDEASKFEVTEGVLVGFLKHIYSGSVVKFFRKQPQPILPI